MFAFPVISKILFSKTKVHVGTPAIEVTFSSIVLCAKLSILFSHSSIKAMDNSGVRIKPAQKGEFSNKTALKSPN